MKKYRCSVVVRRTWENPARVACWRYIYAKDQKDAFDIFFRLKGGFIRGCQNCLYDSVYCKITEVRK